MPIAISTKESNPSPLIRNQTVSPLDSDSDSQTHRDESRSIDRTWIVSRTDRHVEDGTKVDKHHGSAIVIIIIY